MGAGSSCGGHDCYLVIYESIALCHVQLSYQIEHTLTSRQALRRKALHEEGIRSRRLEHSVSCQHVLGPSGLKHASESLPQ